MPIYEYRCQSCGHELEALQKISDKELQDCPECQRPELKKLMSAVGFRLKGGGWYETDFKKDNQRNLHDTGDKKSGDDKKGKDKKSADKSDKKTSTDSGKSGAGKSGKSDKNQSASAA